MAVPISDSSNSLHHCRVRPPRIRGRGRSTGPSFVSSVPPFLPRGATDSNEMFRNEAIDHAVDTLTP